MTTPKFSLLFAKKVEKKVLVSSALSSDAQSFLSKEGKKHSITSFDADKKSLESKPEDEFVIPILESHRDAVLKKLQQKTLKKEDNQKIKTECEGEDNKPLSLDELAAAALIKESSQKNEDISGLGSNNNLTIQLNSNNSIEKEAVIETGKVSSLDDYEEVSVESYGAALLRGMGWCKDKGVGKINKQVVEIVNPTSKAFALTNKDNAKSKEGINEEEEEEEIKKGCFVLIHSGRNRGTYGIVELVDEDHLLVKPARGETTVREVEQNLRGVSAKEYRELSRVINKEMYDEFKAAENKKKERTKGKAEKDNNRTKRKEDKKQSNDHKYNKNGKEHIYDKDDKYDKFKSVDKGCNKIKTESTSSFEKLKGEEIEKSKREDKNEGWTSEKRKKDYKDEGWTSGKRKKDYEYDDNITHYKTSEEEEVESDQLPDKHRKDKLVIHRKIGSKNSIEIKRGEDRHEYYSKGKLSNIESSNNKNDDKRTGNRTKIITESEQNESHHSRQRKKSNSEYFKEKDHKHKSKINSNVRDRQSSNSKNEVIEALKKIQPSSFAIPWARENLKVRIINKDYHNGRYHKEKVIVRSVETVESCTCVTEDGKILEDLNPNCFETVIPKTASAIVLIVNGKYKGQKGRILQLHKEDEKATIQLLAESSIIVKLYYNDICEYICR